MIWGSISHEPLSTPSGVEQEAGVLLGELMFPEKPASMAMPPAPLTNPRNKSVEAECPRCHLLSQQADYSHAKSMSEQKSSNDGPHLTPEWP